MASLADSGGAGAASNAAILEKAVELAYQRNHELAYKFFVRAVENDPQNPSVLSLYGEFLAECGQIVEAKQVLQKCVEFGGNGTVYFSLGQLQDGLEAVTSFRCGIEALEQELANEDAQPTGDDANSPTETKRRAVASAYVRIGEVFMTELCFDENAEKICETCAQKAMEMGGVGNVEALHFAASVYLSMRLAEKAKVCINQAVDVIQRLADDGAEAEEETQISYDVRLGVAKVLMEVGEPGKATGVLETLLLENDNDIECWYLAEHAYMAVEESNTAEQYFKRAADMMKEVVKHNRASAGVDGQPKEFEQQENYLNDILKGLGAAKKASAVAKSKPVTREGRGEDTLMSED